MRVHLTCRSAGTLLMLSARLAAAQGPGALLPLKYAGPPTTADISAADLMTRLYIFADDSMMGRQFGTDGSAKATSYIEREVRRLGLVPAGDSGGFFQYVPMSHGPNRPPTFGRTARNVVAILPGSDENLKHEYVAIGAHSDHIGIMRPALDHDSLRVFDQFEYPEGADSPLLRAPLDLATVRAMRARTDSLHRLHPARRDSIYNGADDDGSGSVALLEIAEAFVQGDTRPQRSILFVWHVGEEEGMLGSSYFVEHPTVPRDSIVAQLNMDMIGRGGARDVTGTTKNGVERTGGPGYLQLVGSRRLSTELGDLVEAVNTDKHLGLRFDYSMDANGHPQQIYCRSDHYSYARFGIPIVFFTTGGHADYHEVTDEPQYIDYNRLAQVSHLVFETALRVADLDHRVIVDKPKPDPHAKCVQ